MTNQGALDEELSTLVGSDAMPYGKPQGLGNSIVNEIISLLGYFSNILAYFTAA